MDPIKQNYVDILNRIPIHQITDHPNILIAAGFWDPERYEAAKICYAFMRQIDDLIDNFKASHNGIGEKEREGFIREVNDWIGMIKTDNGSLPFQQQLIQTIKTFRIPLWTLDDFARSMMYDINNDGFPTLSSFLDYSLGATVAPSSIFVHLCGIRPSHTGWLDPLFEVKDASIPCAIFSYLVHIIRDFQKDQLNNLSYFADDRIVANGLSREEMKKIAQGAPVTSGFRNLMKEYYDLAAEYKEKTREVLRQIHPLVEPRYYLSLLIIFNLYLMVFERIDIENGSFMTDELNPSASEIYDRVLHTINAF